MSAVILTERYNQASRFWPNLLKRKRISDFSVEQILDKYQGFEGELMIFFNINSSTTKLEIEEIFDKNLCEDKKHKFLLLYIISDFENIFSFLNEDTLKVGYDVGVCEEECIYSSIINEVLFGNVEKLIKYKEFLNEHFLFPDRSIAEQYVKLHDQLSIEGEDVEDYMKMNVYEIWKPI
jgi:hypothetical protein